MGFESKIETRNFKVWPTLRLCCEESTKTVWLEITHFWTLSMCPPGYIHKHLNTLSTIYIGCIFERNQRWISIGQNRTNNPSKVIDFTEIVPNGLDFAVNIVTHWKDFSHENHKNYAKGLSLGKLSLTSASFAMMAIKTGFGKKVADTYSGIRIEDFSPTDAFKYLDTLGRTVSRMPKDISSELVKDEFIEIQKDDNIEADEIPLALSDYRELPLIGRKEHDKFMPYAKDSSGKDISVTAFNHIKLKIVSGYAFRGDTRSPSEIKLAGGFLPNSTRDDQWDLVHKNIIEKKLIDSGTGVAALPSGVDFGSFSHGGGKIAVDIEAKAAASRQMGKSAPDLPFTYNETRTDLHVYLMKELLGIFVSLTKSVAIATGFAATTAQRQGKKTAWVYVCRITGGFELPQKGEMMQASLSGVAAPVSKAEQEVAQPGMVDWADVVAFRELDTNLQGKLLLKNEVYIRGGIKEQSGDNVFAEIFELLCNKTQGPWINQPRR
jgi:hypothetical protein